jgi:hypothetical protein
MERKPPGSQGMMNRQVRQLSASNATWVVDPSGGLDQRARRIKAALRTATFNMRRSTCEIEPSSERERFEFWHSTEPIQAGF